MDAADYLLSHGGRRIRDVACAYAAFMPFATGWMWGRIHTNVVGIVINPRKQLVTAYPGVPTFTGPFEVR